jgi:hypothetical protein
MIKEKVKKVAVNNKSKWLYRGVVLAALTMIVAGSIGTEALAVEATSLAGLSGGGTGSDIIVSLTKAAKEIFADLALLSHPAAGIGIAIGALMKKFSMGRQDRVEMGNKLIKDTFIAWGTINSVNAIIFFVTGMFD